MKKQNTDSENKKYLPIEDYGVIGNLHTVCLVSLKASIDFMSFPRFDSPTIFCKLLDADKGGHFSIQPQMHHMVTKQLYLPETNILLTRFFSDEGIAEVIDYMPIEGSENNCSVIRKIATIRGHIKYKIHCAPRFGYATVPHTVEKKGNSHIFIPADRNLSPVSLHSNSTLEQYNNDVVANFSLAETETMYFVLEAVHDGFHEKTALGEYVEETYKATADYWQRWVEQSTYEGHWEEVVQRSALALKLLMSAKYGSMVGSHIRVTGSHRTTPQLGLPVHMGA